MPLLLHSGRIFFSKREGKTELNLYSLKQCTTCTQLCREPVKSATVLSQPKQSKRTLFLTSYVRIQGRSGLPRYSEQAFHPSKDRARSCAFRTTLQAASSPDTAPTRSTCKPGLDRSSPSRGEGQGHSAVKDVPVCKPDKDNA